MRVQACILLLFWTAAALAQSGDDLLNRANLITAAIQQDASQLPSDLESVLPARLAAAWRNVDPQRAQAWRDESLAKISAQPAGETREEQSARFQARLAIFVELNDSDTAQADRILNSLVAQAERANAASMGQARIESQDIYDLGFTLANAIQGTASNHPQRALDLARRIIHLGDGNAIAPAYLNLQASDPALAAQFVQEAMQAARANFDSFLLFGLTNIAEARPNLPQNMQVPDETRSQILDVLARGVLRPAESAPEKANVCRLAASAARLLKQYAPAQRERMRAVIDGCRRTSPVIAQNIQMSEMIQAQPGTPAEGQEQPDKTGDVRARAQLKFRAYGEAARAKEYQRGLDILDSFTKDERGAWPGWNSIWGMAAVRLIEAACKNQDLQAIQQVIARAPDEMRASLLISVASQALAAKDGPYGLAMLAQAGPNWRRIL